MIFLGVIGASPFIYVKNPKICEITNFSLRELFFFRMKKAAKLL